MGRRRRVRCDEDDDGDGDDEGAFPLQYLLPLQPPLAVEVEDPLVTASVCPPREQDDHRDPIDELNLYRQAVPLLHPQSTSAARTIGKMLGNNKIATRILQRNQSVSSLVSTPTAAPNSMRRLQFHKTCEDLFFGFDPITTRTRRLPLHRMRLLLHHYGLEVDDVAYRQWEQSLPPDATDVSLVAFIHACTQWFPEPFLLGHYAAWRQQQREQDAAAAAVGLGKCQSAPQLLHPFDALARRHDDAVAFSYEKCAQDPPRPYKTQDETRANKSHALLRATQQLRRQTKILTRLNASLATASPPSPSANGAGTTHDRLHEEKLARHILQRCGTQALAPSNRRRSSMATSLPSSATGQAVDLQQNQFAAKKLSRQQHTETARAFSASIAMISRHVHNEELRDLREIEFEKQLAIVNDRKQLRRLQHVHCQALAHEKSHQQMRDVVAMKTLAHEEAELARQYLESREHQLRAQKAPFSLSSSTSTLFQAPPEILAAKATVKTMSQRKRLQQMEQEHLDHMRSIQLIDYAYDKKRAVDDANAAKADATLVDLRVENLPAAQEAALATQELWQQIVETCDDLSVLVPPPNSPPAALRYFAPHRPASLLPPFTASTVTPHAISKVP